MKVMLERKGFALSDTHHDFYWLIAFGKKQRIHTYFSDGVKRYDRQLLVKVRRQICLDDWDEFDRFMDCDMDGNEYLRLMIARGHVTPPPPPAPEKSNKREPKRK